MTSSDSSDESLPSVINSQPNDALKASVGKEQMDEDLNEPDQTRMMLTNDSHGTGIAVRENNHEDIVREIIESGMVSFKEVCLPNGIDMVLVSEEEESNLEEDCRWKILDWFLESVDKANTRDSIIKILIPVWITCIPVGVLVGLITGNFVMLITVLGGPIMLVLKYLFKG